MESNPINDRLIQLRDQWVEFTANKASLFKWNLVPDEMQMLDTLVLVEADEAGELADLLFYYKGEFKDDANYCLDIVNFIESKVKEMLLDESDPDPFHWNAPPPNEDEDSQDYLFRVLASLYSDLSELVETIGLILLPQAVSKPGKWIQWLYDWTKVATGQDAVKVAFIDQSDGLIYENLLSEAGSEILNTTANLNMPEALNKVAEDADDGSPGGAYRKEFVNMMNWVGKGDIDNATVSGDRAVAIAEEHKWFNLQIPIFMALAGASMNNEQVTESYDYYLKAEESADKCIEEGSDEGKKLKIHTIFGACSVLIKTKQYAMAAERYLEASEFAAENDDNVNYFESLRMATVCLDKAKKRKDAWEQGNFGLDAVDSFSDEEREQALVGQLGLTLWKITKKLTFRKHRAELEERMTELCGENWKEEAEEALS